ncbi:MAG: nucleoside recognition domain-containing protein [bacterium]
MEKKNRTVGVGAYIALILAIIFFSGIFAGFDNWLRILDFNTLVGDFGEISTEAGNFTLRGDGGTGAKDGFLFALELMPTVIFALAVVSVVEYFGALEAARRLLTPLLRPLMGIPGVTGLALIASLQSTDAGAGMTLDLYRENEITDKERSIFAAFQFSAGATITNFFATGGALYALTLPDDGGQAIMVPMIVPLIIIFVLKAVGANIMRVYIRKVN